MSDKLTTFLGDTPGRVAIKLLVISFVVGIIMAALNWTPLDVVDQIRNFFVRIWNLGFEAFGRVGNYFILGAAVVVPVFILMRLFKVAGRR